MSYTEFLQQKTQLGGNHGFDPIWMPEFLFDFQKYLVEWSLQKGRGAMFADCGLGKTPMQLVWAENVVRKTNGKVLILTPLAVSSQTIQEGKKFGIEVTRSGDGTAHRITVTNYERLHYFSPNDFEGVVCDESSILKSFDGKYKADITAFMRKMKYRFLYTATAAPNDYIELGTSSEALGYLGYMDMLNRFFKNDQNNSSLRARSARFGGFTHRAKWRFKGHAEEAFWRWTCYWARACRMPSDLGFDNAKFILPKKTEIQHIIEASRPADGMLFQLPAIGLKEEREERRRTIKERCEKVAELVSDTKKPALVWCGLNDEGDLLEEMISDGLQVAGKHSDELKENRFLDFVSGDLRVLITKPKIGAWGLNFQHCSHITFFPSHSFEQYYQGVRRCWRFGQKNEIQIDIVSTEGEKDILKNLQHKALQADKMFTRLVEYMNNHLDIKPIKQFNQKEEIPIWL